MNNTRRNEQERIEETEFKQPVNSVSPQIDQIQERLNEVERENVELRSRYWRLQKIGTLPIGVTLSGVGGTILFLSYMLTSSILTFIGLGLTFWGVLIIYISSARHVHSAGSNAGFRTKLVRLPYRNPRGNASPTR